MSQQNQTSRETCSQEISTHGLVTSGALRSPTDSELTLHMMERHDAHDADIMAVMLGVPNKCWGAFCADVEAGRQPW